MNMKVIGIAAAVVVVILAAYMFFPKAAPTTDELLVGSGEPTTNKVMIENGDFSPAIITIRKGDTVVWENRESVPHTIVSDSGNELVSPSLNIYAKYTHTFDEAGSYDYHCSIHPEMKGTIIVVG